MAHVENADVENVAAKSAAAQLANAHVANDNIVSLITNLRVPKEIPWVFLSIFEKNLIHFMLDTFVSNS